MRRSYSKLYLSLVVLACVACPSLSGQAEAIPKGPALKKLVHEYLGADEAARAAIRAKWDEAAPSLDDEAALAKLRKEMLDASRSFGRKLEMGGTNYFYDEKTKRGKYITKGGPAKTLFIGLHGGGLGEGSAESMAGPMGGGGWWWIFPEVLEKTEHGWTTSGTEEFVLELIEAAKRTGKVDPNRIYISGHSMGGFGTWTLGAHHCDVFGGGAAYAGAPSPIWVPGSDTEVQAIAPGVLPSYFQLPFYFFQSLDDKNVPPYANVFANKALTEWKKNYPDGFNYRYEEVDRNGHAAPREGYMPTQKWIASQPRIPRPKKFMWQPVLKWKKHQYWIYWHEPELESIILFEVKPGNVISIDRVEGNSKPKNISILLGDPLIDLTKEIKVTMDGEEKFRGMAKRSFSTLLLTLPRFDADLLFDARIDL